MRRGTVAAVTSVVLWGAVGRPVAIAKAATAPTTSSPATTVAPTTTPPSSTTSPRTTVPPRTSTTVAPTTTAPTTTTEPTRSGTGSGPGSPGPQVDPAPEPAPAPGKPGVSLVSQPPWIATEGVEVMVLHLDEPALASVEGADVQLTFHDSVSSRTDFDRALSGESLGSTQSRLTFPLSDVQLNRRRNFLIGFGLSGSDAPKRAGINRPGVYPVEVGVIDSGIDRGTFLTWLVVVDEDAARSSQPLRFSWIWQLDTGPLERADGSVDPAALPAMRPGGRLDHIASLLDRAGRFPLTLGIGPQTLTVWDGEARVHPAVAPAVEHVKQAAAQSTTQLLPEPYIPIEGPSIEAEGLGEHLPETYVAGSNAIERITSQIPDPRTALVDPVDEATVARLTQMLVGRFVVRDTALVPVPQDLTPAQPFALAAGSLTSPAVATDSRLEQLVDSAGPPALRAQRVVAALAEIAYEAPSQARGVVLSTPANWSPDRATVALLLHDLARFPLVEPATLDTMFSEVAPAERDGVALQRQLAPIAPPTNLPLRASEYDAAVRELSAFEAMVGRDDPSVAAGNHSLLLSLSTANTRAESLAHLNTISANLDELTSGITTTARALTLTARRASIPLSFQNNTGRAGVRVRVHLESPKLIFPDGPDFLVVLPIGHYTQRFAVEARASGTFAMTITLESPGGLLQLGPPTRVTIRSAVFSGIGIALTLGALLFLAGWWGNHFWRTRRARRIARAT